MGDEDKEVSPDQMLKVFNDMLKRHEAFINQMYGKLKDLQDKKKG